MAGAQRFDDAVLAEMLGSCMAGVPTADDVLRICARTQPRHRRDLADWILEGNFMRLQVFSVFRCGRETFAVTMQMLYAYLAKTSPPAGALQLTGATSLFLAAKITSVDNTIIPVDDIAILLDNRYDVETIKLQELEILKVLGWHVNFGAPHDFADQFLARIALPMTPVDKTTLAHHTDAIIDMCYIDPHFIQYGPAIVAAACIACAVSYLTMHGRLFVPARDKESFLGMLRYFPDRQAEFVACVSQVQELYMLHMDIGEPLAQPAHKAGSPTDLASLP